MDMQQGIITNTLSIDTDSIMAGDISATGSANLTQLNITGGLTFGVGAMIYVNGVMVEPINLTNLNDTSPILNLGYEERITKLELANVELQEKLEHSLIQLEFLNKWKEV